VVGDNVWSWNGPAPHQRSVRQRGFFRVLGVEPVLCRVVTAEEERRGCGLPGAVVSYAFWQRELEGSASAIGKKITLNLQSVEIIGVTAPGFSGLEVGRSFDVAVPICSQRSLWSEGNWLDQGTVWWLAVMGRVPSGQPIESGTRDCAIFRRRCSRRRCPPTIHRKTSRIT
jgi:hypothetical protein